MRCARHPFEDGIGVCATCLRERLLVLCASVAGGTSPFASPSPVSLSFRRSASPCIPAASEKLKSAKPSILTSLFGRRGAGGPERKPRRSSSWLSALLHGGRREKIKNTSRPFSSTSNRGMSPENRREPPPLPRQSNISPTSEHQRHCHSGGLAPRRSSSWLSALLHGGRREKIKNTSRPFSSTSNRGMSPENRREPPPLPRQSNISPTSEHQRHCHSGGLAGFAICFSPLATANHPNNNRRSRVSEFSFSGELPRAAAEVPRRPRPRQQLGRATAPSLEHDRSRKLVDLGKFT